MRINYSFTAKTPLFTGSDENAGTMRTLRRERRLLKNTIQIKSTFQNAQERTKALMDVIYPVYNAIDAKLKASHYGFYEAYSGKVKAAGSSPSKKSFLNRLMASCGVEVLPAGHGTLVRQTLDKFSDEEFIEIVREEHQYLMILLREYVDHYKKDKGLEGLKLWDSEPEVQDIDFKKNFVNIPYFGGNSIRGYLRRLIMHDFTKQVGIDRMDKSIYHQLFTGGNLTGSTAYEDIEKKEEYLAMCPPLSLLGSALGNMTIEGDLKVIGGRLQCKENNTGEASFWEFIDQQFQTRHDDSKDEKKITIVNDMEDKSQMIYQQENFVTGSVFNAAFVLTTTDQLTISTFWRMIQLWKEQPFIGGNSARDNGLIDIDIQIPENAENQYLEYIQKMKKEIKEYFGTK